MSKDRRRYDFPMDAACANCGNRWGRHYGYSCRPDGSGDFVLKTADPLISSALEKMEEKSYGSKTPTLDKLQNTSEPKRAPLPFFIEQQERARFDPFKGYAVKKAKYGPVGFDGGPFAGVQLDGCIGFKEPQGKF
jgi:hypothetical protein